MTHQPPRPFQDPYFGRGHAIPVYDHSADTARAARGTQEALEQLLARADAAEAREHQMLFWGRVSGIAAIVAAVLALVAVVVTVLVA